MYSTNGVSSEVFTWKKNVTMAGAALIGITLLIVGILFLQGQIGELPPVGLPPAAVPFMASGGAVLGADILALIILSVLSCRGSTTNQATFIANTSIGIIRMDQRFGKAEWETYIGDVGEEPPPPKDIDKILNSPCPFSGDDGTKVKDTHMLVLIPATVNGEALTLDRLQTLLQKPKKGAGIGYRHYWVQQKLRKKEVMHSYWVLMPRDVIPNSTNLHYKQQEKMVNQYPGYMVPQAIEVAVCISMEFVMSQAYLFKLMYTYCIDDISELGIEKGGQPPPLPTVGDCHGGEIGPLGFDITVDGVDGLDCRGVAPLRRFL